MIRLGLLDFDTSHAPEFVKRLNHAGIEEDQWVEGARVVIACPGESRVMPERIPAYTKEIADLGVPLVDRPEEMIGKVDGMLIETQEGGIHLHRARPFLEAGLPCFIDKPFACSVSDARQLIELAQRNGVCIFSASALRYAPDLVQFVIKRVDRQILGAVTYGPGLLHPGNPGLFHYVLHAVEVLCTLMGPGCERVCCVQEENVDVITARWRDGRVATVRGVRPAQPVYGFVAFTDEGAEHVALDTAYIYRELLKQIVAMFATGQSPLDIGITLEIMAFLEASNKSRSSGASWQTLPPAF